MGWMCSWVAVQGAAKSELLDALSLIETGEAVEPGSRSARMSCAERPGGWLILFSEDFDWAGRDRVLELSRFGLVVGCQFEDKVEMTSIARAARNGEELWRVSHINDPKYRLDVSGEPPTELASIRERLFREQDEDGGEGSSVDFIHDIPLEVAKAVCGYRADEDQSVFAGLKSITGSPSAEGSKSTGLLARLLAPFGGRRH
ncbi:MAG: hypothetical protein JWQ29_3244 [Phenylobacterium sp.]|nr:hypothetical protein [Phenylobacterium sp.]